MKYWIAPIVLGLGLAACDQAEQGGGHNHDAHSEHHESHDDHHDHDGHDHHDDHDHEAHDDHHDHEHHSDAAHQDAGLKIIHGRIRLPSGGRDVTAGYFDIISAEEDAIVSVSSPGAETVEMHTHTEVDGVMSMRKIDEVALPAGEEVMFVPKGLHLMMFGVSELAEGEKIEVTLKMASGAEQTAVFEVVTAEAASHHHH